MIKPIKIEKESLNLNNLTDLEYKYLLEIPKEIMAKYEEIQKHRWDNEYSNDKELEVFTQNSFDVFRFFGRIGETNLFLNYGKMYKANLGGDFLLHGERRGDCRGFLITDELLEDIKGKEFSCSGWRSEGYVDEILEEYTDKELSFDDFVKRFKEFEQKEEEERLARIERDKLKREKEIEGTEEAKKVFDNGEWKYNSYPDKVYGSGKVISDYGNEYTFKKNINKIFTISDLNNAYRNYNQYGTEKLNWIERLSVDKKASYTFVEKNNKRTYVVKFKDDKMYVDNVCVPIARASFFISRADGDSEKLKTLKELSAVKVEFLALDKISIHTDSYTYSNIPIEIKYVDKLWEVTLLDHTIKEDWKKLEIFRHNLQRLKERFYTNDLPTLIAKFDISKSDLFDFLKKTQLLDKLGEEDE